MHVITLQSPLSTHSFPHQTLVRKACEEGERGVLVTEAEGQSPTAAHEELWILGTLGHIPSEDCCWEPTWTPPWDTKFMFLASNASCRQVVFPQASETRVRSFWALSSSLR